MSSEVPPREPSKPCSWCERYTEEYGLPYKRAPIYDHDLSRHFDHVRTIDAGTGDIGGLNGGVHILKRKYDGTNCVEKIINAKERALRREIHILHHLKHPNVVEYISAFITPKPERKAKLYIEYCSLGSIDGLIKRYKKNDPSARIPEAVIWHVFESLTFALQYVHHGIQRTEPPVAPGSVQADPAMVKRLEQKWPTILHCDIKLGNVLLSHKRSFESRQHPSEVSRPFRVVLADFGLALPMGDQAWQTKDRSFCGTLSWSPPEIPIWTEKGDVWALGAVILSLCNLLPHSPVLPPPAGWEGDDEPWYHGKQCRKRTRDVDIGEEHYSTALGDLLYNCLLENAKDRPFSFRLRSHIVEGKRRATELGYMKTKEVPKWALCL